MRKLTLSLAVMAALLPARGYPLGLGEIELNSALNQELNAEIEVLSASPDDANQMIVQLANRDAFNRAGMDRPYLLQQLQFKIVEKQGKPFVKVFTKSAIREPFISFLLEIDWPQGHLLREYTLLLDPPVYNTSGAASTSSEEAHPFIDPADVRAHTQSETPQQRVGQSSNGQTGYSTAQSGTISSSSGRSVTYSTPQSGMASSAVTSQRSASAVSEYRVKQTDTLWSMANRMRPDDSVSVEQMMLALVRKNPEAFINENINGVKRGYILRIPDRNEATQLDRQQAVSQAKEHAALWREYSQAAVSQAPASSMEAETSSTESVASDDAAAGHLSIVGASKSDGSEHAGANQDPDSEVSRLKQELAMAREQLESERVEKEGLRTKLSDLEQKVQSVIQMDDGELAKLQQELQQQQAQITEQSETEQTVVTEEASDTVEAEAVEAITEDAPAEVETSDEVAEPLTNGEEADVTEDATDADAVFVDELESVEGSDTAAVETDTTEVLDATDTADVVEPPAFAQQKPKSFIDNLMNDPKLLGMIGGGLAFVLLLIVLLLKRLRGGKAESQDESVEDNFLDIDNATMQTEASDADDLSMVDTQIDVPAMDEGSLEEAVLNLDDAEAPVAGDQQDDVLAEADVYIAYGIYQQAEDLLKNAIDQNPERDDYRMKLLETHFAAKDATAFEQEATQLKPRKGNDETYWGRVATMGAELCPGSDLFFGAGDVISDLDADVLVPEKPEAPDVELDATKDEESVADLDTDLGLDLGATTEVEALAADLGDDLGLDDVSGLDEDMSFESSDAAELDLAGDLADIANEIEEPAADTSAEDEAASLEFDLGELTDESLNKGSEEAVEAVSAEDEMDDLDIDEDFSLDFAASDLGFEEPEEDTALDAVADDVEDLDLSADLDLGADLEEPSSNDVSDSLVDDESLEVDFTEDLGDSLSDDLGEIDLDDSELDLGSDLDLDEAVDTAELDTEESAAGDEEFDISELSEDLDEVGTKLDLAKAYIDMGDHEGARSILEEVKAEGNEAQQQEAESLLQQAG